MSYSQLVLSEKPYGYWDCSQLDGSSLKDLTGFSNHAGLINVETDKKPIIYGPESSSRLVDQSTITINNIYKVLFQGSEDKPVSIEFFFNIKDSSTVKNNLVSINNLFSCYVISDKIYIESENIKSSINITNWESSQYVCIIYKNNSLSLILNAEKSTSIELGRNYQLKNTSPPDIIFGPSADPSLPIYLNSIAIYTYEMLPGQMLTRLSWAGYDSYADALAVSNGAEIINPISTNDMKNMSILISEKETLFNGEYDNVLIKDSMLTLNSVPPAVVSSLESTLNYSINIDGISFGGTSYIDVSKPSSFFKGYNNIIRQQVLFDGEAEKQTIFSIGPVIDDSYIEVYKSTNNTIVCSRVINSDSEEILSETTDIGLDYTEYFDIAVVFISDQASLIVNEFQSDLFDIPSLVSNFSIRIGNNFNYDSPLTSKIKNFVIDNYFSEDVISYDEIGKYSLKFEDSFSVSQIGKWKYEFSTPEPSISSYATYNFASKGTKVYINGKRLREPGFIPEMIYSVASSIAIEVVLETNDSINDLPVLTDFVLSTFSSSYVPSNNGVYSISPLEISNLEEYPKTEPFEIKENITSALSRPNNIGIKFISEIPNIGDVEDEPDSETWIYQTSSITTGGSLLTNTESENDYISTLEFLIKIDKDPADLELYSIFEVKDSGISLQYSLSGLTPTLGYDLYVDGMPSTGGEIFEENEFYHILIVFNSPVSSEILLGISQDQSLYLNGSIGNLAIYNSVPENISFYAMQRYQAIIGRPYISKKDDNFISIFDESIEIQEYTVTKDGKYFAMKQLPKVKFVQDKWEIVR